MSLSFLDYLISQKTIHPNRAAAVAKEVAEEGKSVIRALEEVGSIPAPQLLKAESDFFGIPEIDLSVKKIPREVLTLVPQDLAENYNLAAFDRQEDTLSVALADPGSFKAREAIEFFARENDLKVNYFVASFRGLKSAHKQYSTLNAEVKQALTQAETKFRPAEVDEKAKAGDYEEIIKSAPVAKMVSVILNHAVDGRASDIHIEPMENKTRVRYRIDGDLHTSLILPKYIHAALVSRIKVLAGLRIDETRVPQDGHIRHQSGRSKNDLRISTIPLADGEKVVMRILESSAPPTLDDLGFSYRGLETIQKNIKKPNGMFLVTGPTGSGKSTTLFSVLSLLNREEVNISTLEDPIEYHTEGVNQSQVNPEVNFTFASGLRALLRQDPDIIMVGEIRDNETAELAIHAALTGHIVLATLHTNDAFGAIPRLFDMKVEPFLLVSTLNVIVAQRLVRRICPACKQDYKIPEQTLAEVRKEVEKIAHPETYPDIDLKNLKFFKGAGCPKCASLGFQGRVAIAEVLAMTAQLKELISAGFKASGIETEKNRQGMLSLRQDGIIKALKGLVLIEEVISVTSENV